MTPLDTIGSQARDAKMILGVRIIMLMRRIRVMAMTIMVIAMQDMEYGIRWWRKMFMSKMLMMRRPSRMILAPPGHN